MLTDFSFERSPLLGDRAEQVYEWFRRSLAVDGDVAECGVYAGDTSRELARYLHARGVRKQVHLFDTFAGLPPIVEPHERVQPAGTFIQPGWFACDRATVERRMQPFTRYVVHEGLFSETFPRFHGALCFIHADADLYRSTRDVIELADRCLSPGGSVVFDDYGNAEFAGIEAAVERHLDGDRYAMVRSPDTLQCFATKVR